MEGSTRGPGEGGCGKTNGFFSWERISMGEGEGERGGWGRGEMRYISRELISGLEVRMRRGYRLIMIDKVHT